MSTGFALSKARSRGARVAALGSLFVVATVIAAACSSNGDARRGAGSDMASGAGGAGPGATSTGTIGVGTGGTIVLGGSAGTGGGDGGLRPCQTMADCH